MAEIENIHCPICTQPIPRSWQNALPPAFATLEQRGELFSCYQIRFLLHCITFIIQPQWLPSGGKRAKFEQLWARIMRIMRLFAFTLQAILIQCHLGGLPIHKCRYYTKSKYLFKPIHALQESTDLWPQTRAVLTVVSLIPAPISGSTNWWDLSNQVDVHMQGIYPTKLLFICKEFLKESWSD